VRVRADPVVVAGAVLTLALVATAALAPAIAPYDPRALGPPLAPPSGAHLLGTNDIGQDIASQVVWGARSAVTVSLGAALVAVVLGVAVGLGSALVGGAADTVAMRVLDVFLAVPQLPLLVLVAALAGPRQANLVVVIGLLRWPDIARQVRSQARSLRQRGWVSAARGFGGGLGHVARHHLLPALGPVVVTLAVTTVAQTLLVEAGLAFLGLADPTAVSWGLMVNRALRFPGIFFIDAWRWWLLPPGLAISLGVLGFMLLGVGLEPYANPRWRRRSP